MFMVLTSLALASLVLSGTPEVGPPSTVVGWPLVWVELSGVDGALSSDARRSMKGALLARLLDEGYGLGRPPSAIALRIGAAPDVVEMRASTPDGREGHRTSVRADLGEVLELELVHRALETVAHVEGAYVPVADARPRVSLEVRGASEQVPAGELYLRLLPIVAAADVSVLPPTADVDWRFCVFDTNRGHRTLRVTGTIGCAQAWRNPMEHREGPLGMLLLEIEREAALPPRRRTGRVSRTFAAFADDPLPPDLAPAPKRSSEASSIAWSSGAALGLVGRRSRYAPPGLDALLRADLVGTGPRGFGVGLALAAMPGGRRHLRFVDVVLGLGPRHRKRWSLPAVDVMTTIGVDVGVLVHAGSPEVLRVPTSGLSFDLPLVVSLVPHGGRVAFDMLVLAGAAAPPIQHAKVWDRGMGRVGVALGVRKLWGAQ
jgi:hypothetical protein